MPAHVVVTPDGKTTYATNGADNTVSAINTTTMKLEATIPVGSGPHGLRPSPDGKWVYVANVAGTTLSVIDTTTNSKVADVEVGRSPAQVAFSPDGRPQSHADRPLAAAVASARVILSSVGDMVGWPYSRASRNVDVVVAENLEAG